MSIIKSADEFVGVPYVVRGRDVRGWDCWGCVCYLRNHLVGKSTPSWEEAYTGLDVKSPERVAELIQERMAGWQQVEVPKAGSVLLFRTLGADSHVGMYLEKGQFIHSMVGCQTAIVPLENWKGRFVAAYDTE